MLFHSLEIQHRKELRDYCTKSAEIEQTGALMFMYIEKTSTDLNKGKELVSFLKLWNFKW